jgi:glyoxylate/hydroxypyruvate reductase A
MNIVFCASDAKAQPWIDAIAAALPGSNVWAWSPDDNERQADYAVVWSPPPALFESQRKLKALFNIGAGVDGILRVDNLPPSLPVVRLDDAGMSVQMAEFVCHAVVRHARQLDMYDANAREAVWKALRPIDREAFPVGVMGLGAIGARVAQSVAGFEYPVFGWSRTRKSLPGITCLAGDDEFDAFLASVRILVCVLPLTAETQGIMNRSALSKLKPGGYVINVARGGHLVEDDLLALLDEGKLAGATLDVFQQEPLPADHRFWRHPKVTVTPHVAARTLRDVSVAQIAGKIRRMECGEAVPGLVESQRGY